MSSWLAKDWRILGTSLTEAALTAAGNMELNRSPGSHTAFVNSSNYDYVVSRGAV